jgi:hypothetical protein
MADLPARPAPADAPAGDGAPPAGDAMPPAGATVDMSQAAGPRPTALVPAGPPKREKKKAVPMTSAGPSEGAVSPADQALAELGTKRGIETLFRSNYRVNMDLSALADAKANIMISINGLIVSILIASIAPGIEKNPWLYLPTSLFLVGCLGSLVFAVLAARPRVQSAVVTKESALRNRTNILFFGNFHRMSQDDYVDAMKQVVQDPTQIYEMMMKDVYGIGSVLQKKYKLLRTSYTIFIGALVLGVVSFIGVFGYATLRGPDVGYTAPAATEAQALPPGTRPGTGGGILP